MKTISVTLLMLFVHSLSVGQDPPRIVPPAPEATSVFKFSEVPVSTYTGLPNISIPVHEIRCKQLTIPINLSYHARGIKVDEMAARVGLGWSLNYGGMMSRQIRGSKADEEPFGFLTQNYYNSVFDEDAVELRQSMLDAETFNDLDRYPDKFMFNANNLSGSFIFNQVTKDILLKEYKDITITKTNGTDGKIDGWVLTDEAGNKFYYGKSKDGTKKALDYEWVQNYSFTTAMAFLGDAGSYSYSSWYLMEIETPFNETIKFEYEAEEIHYYRHSYDKGENGSNPTSFFSSVNAYQYQLKRIEYDQGEIRFIASETEREDLNGGHVLDRIQIFDNVDSVAKKEYQFLYHYTTSPDNYNQLNYLKQVDPPASKRLFLSSIQEIGWQSSDSIPPYTFHYNNITPLPNRFSTSQDFWGYYNGANNGQFLTYFGYGQSVDRSVNEDLSSAGLLEKLVYPTGGSVEFTFEPNVALRPAFMNEMILPSFHKIESRQMLDGFLKNEQYQIANGVYAKDSIVIGESLQGNVLFEIQLPMCPAAGEELTSECVYNVWLTSSTGAQYYLYPFGTEGQRSRSVPVPPGMYTLKVEQNNPLESGSFFYVTLEWEEKDTITVRGITDPKTMIPGPGKRIRKIEYKGIDSTFVKEYEYLRPDGLPSGVILGLPGFYTTNVFTSFGCGTPGSPLSIYQGNNVGYYLVTEYHGTSVSNIGKTEFVFTIMIDGGTYYKFPYHLPDDNEWRRGKNRLTKIYKKNELGAYSLLKEVENNYVYRGDNNIEFEFSDSTLYEVTRTSFKLPLIVWDIYDGNYLPDPNSEGHFKIRHQTGGTSHLASTRETNYENGVTELETETKYYYDYDKHYQVKGIENILSDSSKVMTVMTYPLDYTQGTSFIDLLKSNNLMSYPIEKVTYVKRNGAYKILSGVLNKYSSLNPGRLEEVLTIDTKEPVPLPTFRFSNRPVGELPLTGTQMEFLPYNGYVPRINYEQYDTKGNILQYSTPDNIKMSYLWGYNQGFPVAEIKNATYEQVLNVLGQTVIDELNNSPGTDEQVRLKLQPLYTHPSLKNAQVTIYTFNTFFGMTSKTDYNGIVSYYKYDSLGRLTTVEDQNHHIVKQLQYNYRSQE